jgi:hypothetical protein
MPSIFHKAALDLAVRAQDLSVKKYGSAENDILRDAFYVLLHDSVCVHRAIGCLVDEGWSGPGAALLRTLTDMSISAVALENSSEPRMAAFRYLYAGFRR